MTDRCRSCDAPIEWAITEKGRRIPLDPEPTPTGNIIVSAAGTARVIGDHPTLDVPADAPRYVSHFATCPNSVAHRRKRGRR